MHPTQPNILLSGGEDGKVNSTSINKLQVSLRSQTRTPIHSLDGCIDELAGPLLLTATDDESISVEQLLESF